MTSKSPATCKDLATVTEPLAERSSTLISPPTNRLPLTPIPPDVTMDPVVADVDAVVAVTDTPAANVAAPVVVDVPPM